MKNRRVSAEKPVEQRASALYPRRMSQVDPNQIDVIAPNFKKRLSGVTATVVRLVPLQAREIAIASAAPDLPDHVPQIRPSALITMARSGPSGPRVWHARRNTEMLAGIALKRLLGKRLKLLFTSASQRHHTGYSRWLINQMDRIVATSSKGAAYLDRPADVILHGIDTESFSPPEDRTALQAELCANTPELAGAEGPFIGCYGRIRAQKGTDVFVHSMMEALKTRQGTAVIMGRATGPHEGFLADLKTQIADAGLSDRIRFLPEVPVHDMARWYQLLDLFIAPQRWEGFGLTPLEAMACAVPTIATRVGAFEELVIDGQTGALIDPGEMAQMAQAASGYLDDPQKLTQQAANARAHVAQGFKLEDEAAALTAIYRDMLNS